MREGREVYTERSMSRSKSCLSYRYFVGITQEKDEKFILSEVWAEVSPASPTDILLELHRKRTRSLY
jgi:hypothetical protein